MSISDEAPHRSSERSALEGIVVRLAGFILDNVVTAVRLVDVDLALWQHRDGQKADFAEWTEKEQGERYGTLTFSAM